MDINYIKNCLNQLQKWLNAWHGIIPEQLTDDELKGKDEVGMKAWFVFNGLNYIETFCNGIKNGRRKNEYSFV